MKPLSLPPAALEACDEMGAKLRLEEVGKRENRRGAAGAQRRGRRRIETRKHALPLVQGGDVDDAVHRIEDDPGPVGAEGARHIAAVPQENDRGKPGFERACRPCAGFSDDGEEGRPAFADQALVGRKGRERSLCRGIGDRAEEGERDISAGKGIEGQPMAARIEQEGAVAPLGAGFERKVEGFGHGGIPVDGAAAGSRPSRRERTLAEKA
jgi:hypothetical protein